MLAWRHAGMIPDPGTGNFARHAGMAACWNDSGSRHTGILRDMLAWRHAGMIPDLTPRELSATPQAATKPPARRPEGILRDMLAWRHAGMIPDLTPREPSGHLSLLRDAPGAGSAIANWRRSQMCPFSGQPPAKRNALRQREGFSLTAASRASQWIVV
jgi:hypothetical protein